MSTADTSSPQHKPQHLLVYDLIRNEVEKRLAMDAESQTRHDTNLRLHDEGDVLAGSEQSEWHALERKCVHKTCPQTVEGDDSGK